MHLVTSTYMLYIGSFIDTTLLHTLEVNDVYQCQIIKFLLYVILIFIRAFYVSQLIAIHIYRQWINESNGNGVKSIHEVYFVSYIYFVILYNSALISQHELAANVNNTHKHKAYTIQNITFNNVTYSLILSISICLTFCLLN